MLPSDHVAAPVRNDQRSARGAYILCEGLWRQDNSTLSRYDDSLQTVINDFFSRVNSGLRLGDTANDMVLWGDTLFIAVSTSRTIEILRASTGVWIGRIRFSTARQEPRSLTIVNDSVAFVSNLNDDSITEFHPRTFQIRRTIPVGPAPEGIASTDRYVFVANSGYGDFRAREPKAGTVSVIDLATHREVRTLTGMPNVTSVKVAPARQRLYAAYRHLFSQPDSVGGVVEFDAVTLQELRRWRVPAPASLTFTPSGDTLILRTQRGIEAILLRSSTDMAGERVLPPVLLFANTTPGATWYGLNIHPRTGNLWIANARNYTVDGEIIITRRDGSVVRRFDVGLNPSTIVFF
jgi:hypothetical protein